MIRVITEHLYKLFQTPTFTNILSITFFQVKLIYECCKVLTSEFIKIIG